jgi:hypothetical protein
MFWNKSVWILYKKCFNLEPFKIQTELMVLQSRANEILAIQNVYTNLPVILNGSRLWTSGIWIPTVQANA